MTLHPIHRGCAVILPLTQGRVTVFDEQDADLVHAYRWFAARSREAFYAHSNATLGGKGVTLRLHRLIMGAGRGQVVDHINGDTLDNRRINLRLCTMQQNTWNQRARRGSSSFRGVSWNIRKGKWTAIICRDRRLHYLGEFHSEEDAARAYDAAAHRLHGEFARLNFSEVPHASL